jgi:hypothetical protein
MRNLVAVASLSVPATQPRQALSIPLGMLTGSVLSCLSILHSAIEKTARGQCTGKYLAATGKLLMGSTSMGWCYDSDQMSKRTLKFLLYSIHGHLPTGTPDYTNLFRALTQLKGRYKREGGRVIAIGAAYLTHGAGGSDRLSMIVYTGDADKSVLYFDLNQQAEFSSLMESGRFVAKKTHVLIDPGQRTLMIEAGRSHPPAEELAQFIEDEAQEISDFAGLELSFAPVAAAAFASKIDQMKRIQSVTVSIARPNVDWGDRYDQLTKLADESKAKVIDTTIRARRNEGLSKENGLIPNLKHWLSEKLSAVSSAKLKGVLSDGSGLIELKLSDNIETINVTADLNVETGHPLDSVIEEKLNSFLDQRERTQ